MGSGPSDILEEFRQGSLAAFESLFREHERLVYGWILGIVRNPAAAEDLTVETFWRIHRARARFEPAWGFSGWARRIATRAALDWLRARRREETLPEEMPAPATADAAVAAEIRAKIAQAFARLPPKLHAAAALVLIEEQPHKEAAAAMGISVVATKLRVFRAVRLLRKELDELGVRP